MEALVPYILVGLGGFAGAIARFEVGRLAPLGHLPFPFATFIINVSGSFLLGLLGAMIAARVTGAEAMRLALGVGFLGAFTTFSTFEMETHGLLDSGAWLLATAYVVASVFVGLAAVRAGLLVSRLWLS